MNPDYTLEIEESFGEVQVAEHGEDVGLIEAAESEGFFASKYVSPLRVFPLLPKSGRLERV